MNTFEGNKRMLEDAGIEFEAYEAYDTARKVNCLVIAYWDSHARIEMVFDIDGKYLYTDEENDWDYI